MPYHILWLTHRHNARQRVRMTDGRRVSDHGLQFVSETRRQIQCPLPGFPQHSPGWRVLEAQLRAGGQTVEHLCGPDFSGQCTGCAVVGDPTSYRGPLQRLGPEADFAMRLQSASRGMFFRIIEAAALQEPLHVGHHSAEVAPHCTVYAMTARSFERALQGTTTDGRIMQDVLGGWADEFGLDGNPQTVMTSCIQLWPPIAWASARSSWRSLFLGEAQRVEAACSFMAFLKEAGRVVALRRAVAPRDASSDVSPNAERLRQVAEQLRMLTDCVQRGAPLEDPETDLGSIELDVLWLEQQASMLDAVSDSSMEGFGRFGSQVRYKLLFLIQAFSLSTALRTSANLRPVIELSLRVALPAQVAQYFISALAERRMPTAPVLSHFSFVIDASLMRMARVWYESELRDAACLPAIHMMIDSSPQGGVDWENSFFRIVRHSDVVGLLRDYHGLVRSCRSRADLEHAPSETLEEERGMMLGLRERLIGHHNVPVGLGARQTDVLHKAKAFYHQVWLETGSVRLMSRLLASIVTCTGDLGVESSLPSAPAMPFGVAFPYMCTPAGEEDDQGLAAGCVDPEAPLHLHQCMYIAGAMHIVSNITNSLLDTAPNSGNVLNGLRCLSGFLHGKLTRNLFVSRCLIGDAAVLRPLFATFSESVADWRWESVLNVTKKLLELEQPLRARWRRELMVGDAPAEADVRAGVEQGIGAFLETADWAVASNYFWAYLSMLGFLADFLGHISHFSESCPCHSSLRLGDKFSWQEARRALARLYSYRDDESGMVCPLVGCRAPEVAVGAFDAVIDEVAATTTAQLLLHMRGNLTLEERRCVLEDFDHMKGVIVYTLRSKFAPWRVLPRLLCGLGHWDEEQARACGRRALRPCLNSSLLALHIRHARSCWTDAQRCVDHLHVPVRILQCFSAHFLRSRECNLIYLYSFAFICLFICLSVYLSICIPLFMCYLQESATMSPCRSVVDVARGRAGLQGCGVRDKMRRGPTGARITTVRGAAKQAARIRQSWKACSAFSLSVRHYLAFSLSVRGKLAVQFHCQSVLALHFHVVAHRKQFAPSAVPCFHVRHFC